MKYYNHLEDYIKNLYLSIDITTPEQINIKHIAFKLNIIVLFGPHKSMCFKNIIYIDSRVSKEEQWEQFAHELCHVLWHDGNQLGLYPPFREYQEWKANSFASHFCVPTFMLEQLKIPTEYRKAILFIQNKFLVEENFAKKRLGVYLAKKRCITSYI